MNENFEQTLLIKDIIGHIAAIQKRFQSEGEDEEKRWMIKNATESIVIQFLKEATVQMLHVLDAIGELEPVNGITISRHFGIPRGSVSKITQRLVKLGIIHAESLSSNKKEVLFRLTPSGEQAFKLHKQLHEHMDENFRIFLSRYNLNQIRFLSELMREVLGTSWVGSEMVSVEAEDEQEDYKLSTSEISSPRDLQQQNEILGMLQKFDSKKLSKVKELIRIVFLED
ncbi:winged helix DNA-binding protein [Paenibacillus sp. FSL R10-2782]|uniref:winged helix DNA-binding protein n=1 Tax=Paenibacillus sp. FSL R10-2782 TaxID=2954661 RepID=UPI003158092A